MAKLKTLKASVGKLVARGRHKLEAAVLRRGRHSVINELQTEQII